MNNQEKENELYTAIGQYIVDTLDFNSITSWDKAVFTVRTTDGLTEYWLECIPTGKSKLLETPSLDDSQINIYFVIKDLKGYTEENNYTTWNKFIFELSSEKKFDITYSWDQYFHDNRE